jgi:hypothetical protein
VKGQTGNPGGRLDQKPMRDAIGLALAELHSAKDAEGKAVKFKKLRLVAEALVDKALQGDVTAIKEINDRMDGKALQTLAGTAPDGSHTFVVRLIHEGKPKGTK